MNMVHGFNLREDRCPLWPDTPYSCTVILNVQRTFSSLSLIGCLFVCVVVIVSKKGKTTVQKLIFWLSVSGFIRSTALLLTTGYNEKDSYCSFKGFIHNYLSWAVLLWVFMITINCLMTVKRRHYEKYFKLCHIIV